MYPAWIEITGDDLGEIIMSVKEQLNNVPDYGAGYGLLGYDQKRESAGAPSITVRLNYLGEFGTGLSNELFIYEDMDIAKNSDDKNALTAQIDFNLMVVEGNLRLEILYNRLAHRSETIHYLSDTFLEV